MRKKILLLGSGELGKEFVIACQRLGQYVIAVDSYPGAPAMQVAHENEVINMLDGDELDRLEGSMTKEEFLRFVNGILNSRPGKVLMARANEKEKVIGGKNVNGKVVASASGHQPPTLIGIKEGKLEKSQQHKVPKAHKIERNMSSNKFNRNASLTSLKALSTSAKFILANLVPIFKHLEIHLLQFPSI